MLFEKRLCTVSRPWARAMPLSISCLSVFTTIHTPVATDERLVSRAGEKVAVIEIYSLKTGQHRVAENWKTGEEKKKSSHKEKELENQVYKYPWAHNIFYSSISGAAEKKIIILENHVLPSVTEFPLCFFSPQKTPGNLASNPASFVMGHGWAPISSWAPLSPTTATAATR